MRKSLIALCGLALWATPAAADDLKLSGNQHWLVVASSKDKDTAIGIARYEHNGGGTAKVVSSKSGYFAVVVGPVEAASIDALKKADTTGTYSQLPKDALLSQGDNYIDTVWTDKGEDTVSFKSIVKDKPVELSDGDLSATVTVKKLGDDTVYIDVTGKDAQGPFNFVLGKDLEGDDQMSADFFDADHAEFNKVALAHLDPKVKEPQIVITDFSGGAHCCTTTSILERNDGKSSVVDGGELDGDQGFAFENAEGGGMNLISADNVFLYAFDSYAGSIAPDKIQQLQGDKLVDVTSTPAQRARLVQDLAYIEFAAKVDPSVWKTNGFLAGWVAAKIRLGQGDEAWATFLKNYERNPNFGPQICTTGQKVDDCPSEKLKFIPTPKALAQFLKDNDYTPLPKAAEAALK